MVFEEKKPGVFSISTVQTEEGETFKLDADEAVDIITKLNGMVVMMQLTTPEKKRPDVVTLNSSGDSSGSPLLINGQLALPPPEGSESDVEILPMMTDVARDLLEVDTGEEGGAAAEGGAIPKLNLQLAAKTDGGTKHYRKVEDKEKREDSDSSVNASPELQKSQPVMGKEKDKAKTTPPPRKQTKSKQEKNKPRK